jgi:hypothetical protein
MAPLVIRYSARQVALILCYAAAGNVARMARRMGTSARELRRMMNGEAKPDRRVLAFLQLEQHGREYLWYPR